MRYIILLTVASVATGARLEKVYLPPNSGSSSGVDAGLKPPLSTGASPQNSKPQSYPSASASGQSEILRYENEINEQGYHYAYETSDGTKAEQDGRVIPGSTPEEGSLQVAGSYSYVGNDGQTYSITYTADENGFQARGDHLPTPPPIPEEILKSLERTKASGQYDSGRSSYDADAGY